MSRLALTATAAAALSPTPPLDARFARPAPGEYARALRSQGLPEIPFANFSAAFVAHALATPTNWTARGRVTPAKDQGAHGCAWRRAHRLARAPRAPRPRARTTHTAPCTRLPRRGARRAAHALSARPRPRAALPDCGTFGRVAAAEGQFARWTGRLRAFSEEQLIDCVGWDQDQAAYFSPRGFMTSAAYPYNTTGPDMDPPIPNNPCRFDAAAVVPGSGGGFFNGSTGHATSEAQLAAFVFHNGPTTIGINADVLGLREKGCEARGDCFITADMCAKVAGQDIDHLITLVGYGTDAARGDYWIVRVARVE